MERLASLGAAFQAQELDGLHRQLRMLLPLGNRLQDLPRPRRTALAENEERLFLQLHRMIALQKLFQDRDGSVRVHVHEGVQRVELELFVLFISRVDRSATRLSGLDFESSSIVDPGALAIVLLQPL